MRSILFLLSIGVLFSCSSKNHEDISHVDVPLGYAYVQAKAIDDEIVRVLEYTGVRVLEDIDIKVHTNKSHYFFFAAVVDYEKNENGGYSSADGQLSAVKRFDGCFFYDLVKDDPDEYVIDQVGIELMVDKKMNKVLGNDSLYISINGFDYKTMPEPMRLSSYSRHTFDNGFYNLSGVVPLFTGTVDLKANEDKHVESKFLLGMVSYDCKINYDFNGFFNSDAFSYAVGFSQVHDYDELPKNLKLDINDFIIESED